MDNENVYEQILEKANTLWLSSRKNYRDGKLEVGRLLHQYVVKRLQVGDKLNEAKRHLVRATRHAVILDISHKLRIRANSVGEIIRTAAAVDLLSSGDLGEITYRGLRYFCAFIHRRARGKGKIRSSPHTHGLLPSELEQWSIRDGYETVAKSLLATAVRERWDEDKIIQEVRSHMCKKSQSDYPIGKRVIRQNVKAYIAQNRVTSTDSISLDDSPKRLSSDDVVETVITLVSPNPDVIDVVIERLMMLKKRAERIATYADRAGTKEPLFTR